MDKVQAIILCGLDGSGKSTQAKKLIEYLGRKKIKTKYLWLRAPNRLSLPLIILLRITGIFYSQKSASGKEFGAADFRNHQTLKKLWAKALLLDFKFSRHKLLGHIRHGYVVVLDRFVVDALVDLIVVTGDDNLLQTMTKEFTSLVPTDSKIFYLDIKPAISYTRNQEENTEILKKRRELYLKISKLIQMQVIEGSKSIDDIHGTILKECGFES